VHVPALSDPHDAVYRYTSWRFQATPYGPLFTLGTYALARLSLPIALWTLKLATVSASLLCAGLTAACARRLGRPPVTCALVIGLNPVLLVYGVGGVHNDFLMMAVWLAALFFMLGHRERLGAAAAIASVAVKATTAILTPFLLLRARRRGRAVLAAAGSALALIVLTVVVFGTRAPGLSDQANTVTTLSLPSDVASILGVHLTTHCAHHHYTCVTTGFAVGTTALFVLALALLLWRAWRGADPLVCAGWAAIALVLTLTSVMPWYLLWFLPLAVLGRSRRLQAASAILGVLLVVASQPASHLIQYGH
jgi:alpha-1,6-mannosyltransferase